MSCPLKSEQKHHNLPKNRDLVRCGGSILERVTSTKVTTLKEESFAVWPNRKILRFCRKTCGWYNSFESILQN